MANRPRCPFPEDDCATEREMLEAYVKDPKAAKRTVEYSADALREENLHLRAGLEEAIDGVKYLAERWTNGLVGARRAATTQLGAKSLRLEKANARIKELEGERNQLRHDAVSELRKAISTGDTRVKDLEAALADEGALRISHEGRVERLEDALREVRRLAEQSPAGVEYDADPNDPSPDDMFAFLAGLTVQACDSVLTDEERLRETEETQPA